MQQSACELGPLARAWVSLVRSPLARRGFRRPLSPDEDQSEASGHERRTKAKMCHQGSANQRPNSQAELLETVKYRDDGLDGANSTSRRVVRTTRKALR